ncbi:hypothetical protein BsWGS_23091 [Bradybaena similaris]
MEISSIADSSGWTRLRGAFWQVRREVSGATRPRKRAAPSEHCNKQIYCHITFRLHFIKQIYCHITFRLHFIKQIYCHITFRLHFIKQIYCHITFRLHFSK